MNPTRAAFSADVEEYLRRSLASDKETNPDSGRGGVRSVWFQQLLEALGVPPLFTVVRVNTFSSTPEEVQHKLQLVLQERYLAKERICPVVQRHPVLTDALIIPSAGPSSDLPVVKKEVIVDIHCGAAVLRGADIFAPGVMGAHQSRENVLFELRSERVNTAQNNELKRGDDVSVFADLDGTCCRGFTRLFEGRKLFLGNGKALLARNEIFSSEQNVSGVAVQMTQGLYDCPSLGGVLPSLLFLQNFPSIVVGHVLEPQVGERILDMCAAPGGKTTHIAALTSDKAAIVALDKSEPKLKRIRDNCERLGVKSVHGFVFDSTKALTATTQLPGDPLGPPPYPPETFDRVLLDAPCSALGQRPQLSVNMSLNSLKSYPRLQRKLFSVAVQLLKENGTLVYSTCTITTEENEQMVAWALDSFPCLQLAPQTPYLGVPGLDNCRLAEEQRNLVQRFDPAQAQEQASCDVDTIGFFIAKFVKCTQLSLS